VQRQHGWRQCYKHCRIQGGGVQPPLNLRIFWIVCLYKTTVQALLLLSKSKTSYRKMLSSHRYEQTRLFHGKSWLPSIGNKVWVSRGKQQMTVVCTANPNPTGALLGIHLALIVIPTNMENVHKTAHISHIPAVTVDSSQRVRSSICQKHIQIIFYE